MTQIEIKKRENVLLKIRNAIKLLYPESVLFEKYIYTENNRNHYAHCILKYKGIEVLQREDLRTTGDAVDDLSESKYAVQIKAIISVLNQSFFKF